MRAAAWDLVRAPADDKEWIARVAAEVAAAAKAGADAIVFPEDFAGAHPVAAALDAVKDAAGPGMLVVLGNAPHREFGSDHAASRAHILSGGAWQVMDKLDPTPAERAAEPPVRPGMRLPLFRFRGGAAAALPASSLEKPEIAASLKKRGVQLVLVSAPAPEKEGRARLVRAAAARAVELGAAVVVAPLSGAPELHLPAQKGFDLAPQAPAGRDFRIPWKKILDLRLPPDGLEPRSFLEPAPYYQIEI